MPRIEQAFCKFVICSVAGLLPEPGVGVGRRGQGRLTSLQIFVPGFQAQVT